MTPEEFPDTVSDDNPAFDSTVSHQARVYNYLLGGKDYFAADRAYADALAGIYPGVAATARANRDFLGRAVRFMAGEAGLSQFLDIGTGIPAQGSTHEIAQEVRPDSRIVYVDNDPVVLSHARAFLVGREPGTTDYLDADLHDPGRILQEAARTLDFTRPVGLLLVAILHAIPDQHDPYGIVATLMDALPAGSYLVVSHWAKDEDDRDSVAKVTNAARELSRHQYTARSEAEIARFFDGLELAAPGLISAQNWRPAPQDHAAQNQATGKPMPLLAGVGRKITG
jgi:hypothetical protein